MKVKLKISRAGNGFSQKPNDIVEVTDKDGLRLIETGKAERVVKKKKESRKKKVKKVIQ